MSKKKGETLQRVVAVLERALNPSDSVSVTSPKRLPDRTTKRGREHDVVVENLDDPKTVALECRDRSRLVGVPEVEAFSKKCERTTVNRGKLVSSKGFAKTALAVAKDEDIDCLRVDKVEGFDWIEAKDLNVPFRTRLHLTFFAEAERKPVEGAKTFLADGTLVDEAVARQVVLTAFNVPRDMSPPDGEHTQTIEHTNSGCYIVEPDGTRLNVTRLITAVRFRQESKPPAPFEFGEYVDASTGARLSGVAAAHTELAGRGVSLVIAEAASGEKLVAVVQQSGARAKAKAKKYPRRR